MILQIRNSGSRADIPALLNCGSMEFVRITNACSEHECMVKCGSARGEMRLLTKSNRKETLPFRSKRVHQE